MRASTDNRVVDIAPGEPGAVVVEVVNTGEVIDGISANVIGLPEECVSSTPALLPLFPSSTGQLTLSLTVPSTYPAGRHPLTVELVSNGARVASQFLDVDLDVGPRPSMAVASTPRIIRARRSARFVLDVRNDGNLPLDVSLQAADLDRSAKVDLHPATAAARSGDGRPGAAARAWTAHAHRRRGRASRPGRRVRDARRPAPGRRPDRGFGAGARARDLGQAAAATYALSRGLLTAFILLGIIALWAGVFLLGLTKVFSNDPMTKAAPASFFAASQGGAGGRARRAR